jgi:hypothetical protein
MGDVMLQSCTVSLEVVPGSSSDTGMTSSDDSKAVIGIKVEEDTDVTIKVEEIPEPISFPPIKAEPEEVSSLSVRPLSDTCQLPVCVPTVRHMSVTCLCAHCKLHVSYLSVCPL